MDHHTLLMKEIHTLHQLFQEWYTGVLKKEELNAAIGNRLDEHFYIVFPDATKQSKLELLNMMRGDYANDTSFRIEIKDVNASSLSSNLFLVQYQEWQYWGDATQPQLKLMSSAVIQKHDAMYIWIAIHETHIQS